MRKTKERRKKERTEKSNMAVLTAACDRMFCVDKSQTHSFKSIEKNAKNRERADAILSKISKQITVKNERGNGGN